MKELWAVVVLGILFITPAAHPALAASVLMGVNTVGVDRLNEQQRDALIHLLRQDGVKTIRTGFGEKYSSFIVKAYENGISSIVIIYPTYGGTGQHTRISDPSRGLTWTQAALSDADPDGFRAWFHPRFTTIEAAGVRLAAIELGNEINSAGFNGDFVPSLASGRQLGIADLNNPRDDEGRTIAAGYRAYLRVLAVVKDVRDHSKVNQRTPLISAGLATSGLPGKKPGWKLDGVSVADTIAFFRQNGIDNLVDGYGVHVYPSNDPTRTVAQRLDTLNADGFAMCGLQGGKPCWLTEWGLTNSIELCPIDDSRRAHMIEIMRGAFQQLAQQGRLAGMIYYSWSGRPGVKESHEAIFRCGALTDAGKLALSPM
jgi:hypothetical protein